MEAYEQLANEEPGNNEFQVEKFDLMLLGTTMEGNRIVDPRFPPLPKGPLGIPTLPSPTPPEEMEEGQIPLLPEGEPKMPPSSGGEKEMPMLPIPIATEDIQEE